MGWLKRTSDCQISTLAEPGPDVILPLIGPGMVSGPQRSLEMGHRTVTRSQMSYQSLAEVFALMLHNKGMDMKKIIGCLMAVLACTLQVIGNDKLVGAIQDKDGCPGGLQIVVGSGNVELASALAKTGKFDTQLLVNAAELQAERDAVIRQRATGLVSAVGDRTGLKALPYTDNLLNRVVLLGSSSATDPESTAGEIARVLAPRGLVYCGDGGLRKHLLAAGLQAKGKAGTFEAFTKPWPADIAGWRPRRANCFPAGTASLRRWVTPPPSSAPRPEL